MWLERRYPITYQPRSPNGALVTDAMKLRRVPVPVRVASGFAVLGALLVTAYFLRDVPTERATAFPSHTQDPKSLEGRILQFGLCERTEEER
jgi:hypothetical protein